MKTQVTLGILFTLLARRKVSAGYLAAKFDVSVRSVYRYVEELICAGVPIDVSRGAKGGIYISDAYKLPKGFMTREEYAGVIDTLSAMNEQLDSPALRSALEKLSAQVKSERIDLAFSGNLLVDGGTWGDERSFSDKLVFFERTVEERHAVRISYVAADGERTEREILPHLLVYKQSIWYIYAWCRLRGEFRLFRIGRVHTAVDTEEVFERIPFRREDVPLTFRRSGDTVEALFEISPSALGYAQDWLGVDNVYEREGKYYAELTLPDDEMLIGNILLAGSGFRVLSPLSLASRVKEEAARIAALYAPDVQ